MLDFNKTLKEQASMQVTTNIGAAMACLERANFWVRAEGLNEHPEFPEDSTWGHLCINSIITGLELLRSAYRPGEDESNPRP